MDTIVVSFYRHVHMTGMPMCAMPGERTVLTNFQHQWINGRAFPVINYSLWTNMLNAANFWVTKQNKSSWVCNILSTIFNCVFQCPLACQLKLKKRLRKIFQVLDSSASFWTQWSHCNGSSVARERLGVCMNALDVCVEEGKGVGVGGRALCLLVGKTWRKKNMCNQHLLVFQPGKK